MLVTWLELQRVVSKPEHSVHVFVLDSVNRVSECGNKFHFRVNIIGEIYEVVITTMWRI